MKKEIDIRNAKCFETLLDIKYGKTGTSKRKKFEAKAQYFVTTEMMTRTSEEPSNPQTGKTKFV
ncbi:hypothetical protein [Dyadobacter sp. CY312]|uniref:hypothetical protein n=1 Tax=Dyadobacter sp. CY312 TaxID=2907303 RepID=UPI001F492E11|nr:hypothetical protein [Dyadobacter sp. CY312]MCE7039577.1 hypothetical protein [Dyadobacter sp. CY312]